MSANLDMTGGRANMAFTGDRKDIWHREGTGMAEDQSFEDWINAAGQTQFTGVLSRVYTREILYRGSFESRYAHARKNHCKNKK